MPAELTLTEHWLRRKKRHFSNSNSNSKRSLKCLNSSNLRRVPHVLPIGLRAVVPKARLLNLAQAGSEGIDPLGPKGGRSALRLPHNLRQRAKARAFKR